MNGYEHNELFRQLSQWRRQIKAEMVEAAFEAFYDHLTRSEHFRQYFSSDEQIRHLVQAQKRDFIEALTLSDEAFRAHYVALGGRHARMGIALEDLVAGLQIIRDQFLRYQILDVHLTYQFIDRIQQHLAEGYFVFEIEGYLNNIRQAESGVRRLLDDERMVARLMQPLRWLIDVMSHWEAGQTAGNGRIGSVEISAITDLINALEMDAQQRAQLHQLHREQHALAQSLDHFLREKAYLLVTFMLSRLYAVTMAMFNMLMTVESQQQVERLRKDALTGLLLRHELGALLRQVRKACVTRGRLGVLMLDLDHFKLVNDRYGHRAGDAVLRQAAQRLRHMLREQDYTVRYGGEEFLVLLPCLSLEALTRVAERVRQAIADEPMTLDDGTMLRVTVSVGGVSLTQQPALTEAPPEHWIEQADRNLYAAKRAGRNRVVVTPFAADTADGR